MVTKSLPNIYSFLIIVFLHRAYGLDDPKYPTYLFDERNKYRFNI